MANLRTAKHIRKKVKAKAILEDNITTVSLFWHCCTYCNSWYPIWYSK